MTFVRQLTVRGLRGEGLECNDQHSLESRIFAAVRATEGQVLWTTQSTIDAYFGASCGGETANIRDLWGATPASYLRGVRDEYCDAGPHANWTDTITRADLLRALQSDSRTDVGNRVDQVMSVRATKLARRVHHHRR
jgi:SpoIID/LytB domain protein